MTIVAATAAAAAAAAAVCEAVAMKVAAAVDSDGGKYIGSGRVAVAV
jgi:hypothetical protein